MDPTDPRILRAGCISNLQSLLMHVAGEALDMHARLERAKVRALSTVEWEKVEADLRRMAMERALVEGYVAMVEAWAGET